MGGVDNLTELKVDVRHASHVDMCSLSADCIKIGVLKRKPFLYTSIINNRTLIEGPIAELWSQITSTLNLSYKLTYETEGDYGYLTPNGSWSGAAGVLERKEVDLMIGYFAPKYPKANGTAFTSGFSHSPVVMLSGIPPETVVIDFQTIFNFQTEMYFMIPITLFVVSAVEFVSGKRHQAEDSFLQTLWSFFGTLLGKGISRRLVTSSQKFLAYFWWFFAFILIISTSATLNSKFSSRVSKPISNLDELIENPEIVPIIADSSYLRIHLPGSSDPLYEEIWRRSEQFPGFSKSPMFAIQQVSSGKGVLIDIETDLYHYLMENDHYSHRQTHLSQATSWCNANSFQHSTLLSGKIIQEMNNRIVQYSSSRILEGAELKYYRRILSNFWTKSDSSVTMEPVEVNNVLPVLTMWLAGELFATLSLAVELFLNKLSELFSK